MKKACKVLILMSVLILAACAARPDKDGYFSIEYRLGKTESHFTAVPLKAKHGDTVELRTDILIDSDIHVYVDGKEITKSHYDSDYWAYSFTMPADNVVVTAEFYTKDEIWGRQ